MINKSIEIADAAWPGYELIDSGDRKRLERFGDLIVVREEPKAWWRPTLPPGEWNKAVALMEVDKNPWEMRGNVPREWRLEVDGIVAQAKFVDKNKHVGLFPEQYPHWQWIQSMKPYAAGKKILNLFGYTGVASLMAAKAGFQVTHVDASKPSITWGNRNQELSGLADKPIRWILDDAMKFVKREVRRGNKYDGIILDPPSYGRGPKKEIWKVEQMLPELLDDLRQILTEDALFVILNLYSIDASSLMAANMLEQMMKGAGGTIQPGELVLNPQAGDRVLPMSIFARWSSI